MTLGPYLAYHELVRSLGPSMQQPLDRLYAGKDISSNRNDGASSGGISIGSFDDSPGGIAGPPGAQRCTDFDGGNDQITTAYNPYVAGSVRSFCAWANRDTSSSADCLFGGMNGSGEPELKLEGDGPPSSVTWYANTDAAPVSWPAAWPGNVQWVHWALVVDDGGDTAALYINGPLVSSQAAAVPYSAPGTLSIGSVVGGFDFFDGKMAHFAVFERALTAGEVLSLYKAGAPGS